MQACDQTASTFHEWRPGRQEEMMLLDCDWLVRSRDKLWLFARIAAQG